MGGLRKLFGGGKKKEHVPHDFPVDERDRQAIDALTAQGVDLGAPVTVRHSLSLPNAGAIDLAKQRLAEHELQVEATADGAGVTATQRITLDIPTISRFRAQLTKFAERQGGTYGGWALVTENLA
jgi:hypothetical protein